MKKILVIGAGYVGMAYTLFLAKKNHVTVLDVDNEKIQCLQNGNSFFSENQHQEYLDKFIKNITPVSSINNYAFDYILLCLPTNYDEKRNAFDTTILETEIKTISKQNSNAITVIKSTVPVGFTELMSDKYNLPNILFSPEFLREGMTLTDVENPSRIIIGGNLKAAKKFDELINHSLDLKYPTIFMKTSEAESVKLFSNTYLAMRIAFFNEVDSYCIESSLDTKKIIEGVSKDPRIGEGYNNPSFGYGGYCLPKDTKQLLATYGDIPQNLISSIVQANSTRMDFIANQILEKRPKTIGIYKLSMKMSSDNFRHSSILGIINRIEKTQSNIIIYDKNLTSATFLDYKVYEDFESFAAHSDVIIANRFDDELYQFRDKVFSRDIFNTDI